MSSKYSFVKEMIEEARTEKEQKAEDRELKKGVKGVFGKLEYSIVIPTYNDRANIINCLNSITGLHYPKTKFEVIVVDDGSTDRSFEALQSFKADHQELNLVLVRQENRGPCGARNTGLLKARNDFIAFIDSDETAEPNWLKNAQKYFERENVGAVEGRIVVPEEEKITPFTHQTPIPHAGEFVTGNMIYRKGLVEELGYFDERFYDRKRKVHFREDADLAFKVLEKGFEIVFAPEVLTFHPPQKADWKKPLKLAKRHYFDPLLFKKHPEKAEEYISNFEIKRPRQKSYLVYGLALLGFGTGLVTGNGLLLNASLSLWLATYLFVYWLHVRYVKLQAHLLKDFLLLIPITALVPLYFWEAYLRGTIRFKMLVI